MKMFSTLTIFLVGNGDGPLPIFVASEKEVEMRDVPFAVVVFEAVVGVVLLAILARCVAEAFGERDSQSATAGELRDRLRVAEAALTSAALLMPEVVFFSWLLAPRAGC